jgi:hypothetical protein
MPVRRKKELVEESKRRLDARVAEKRAGRGIDKAIRY